MDKNLNKLGFIGVGVAGIGLILSFLLVLEYYGNSGVIGNNLCGAIGDANSCKEVAESAYSAIRIPGIFDIPMALLGFSFYGSVGYGLFRLGMAESEASFKSIVNLLMPFTILGLIVDFILFLISLFVIEKICSMCLMTYVVTITLFIIAFVAGKKTLEVKGDSIVEGLKKNFLNYAIAFLAFFAVGMAGGQVVSGKSNSLETSSKILSDYSSFESKVAHSFDLSGASVRGDRNAPITIVEFADYNCGHCMHASHILDQILREFDGMVKVVYMNFPLDGNCNRFVGRQSPGASSCVAASAALCADSQGKYAQVHQELFKDNENGILHSTVSVMNIASRVGLNMNEFRSCMSSERVRNQIEKEVNEAAKVNVQSTPSIFINGKALTPGTPDPNYLRGLLRYLVEKI